MLKGIRWVDYHPWSYGVTGSDYSNPKLKTERNGRPLRVATPLVRFQGGLQPGGDVCLGRFQYNHRVTQGERVGRLRLCGFCRDSERRYSRQTPTPCLCQPSVEGHQIARVPLSDAAQAGVVAAFLGDGGRFIL
jgi:hypothetical protein